MTKENKIVAWSYSRLSCYESCPLQFKYRNIDKLPEPKAAPMIRGIKIHNQAAKYLSGETKIFPPSCENFRELFNDLLELTPIVEQKWAFDKNWKSVRYFHPTVKLRVTLDVGLNYKDGTAEVIDHKTGKFYPDNTDYKDQGVLFGGAMIKKFPEIHHVTTRLWFLDSGDEVIEEYGREEILELLADLEERAEIMLNATYFPPKPSWKCGGVTKEGKVWGCHWRASNNGPCKFG